jgi:arylsulfatase A-like enzyme
MIFSTSENGTSKIMRIISKYHWLICAAAVLTALAARADKPNVEEGVRFASGYMIGNMCGPSRAAIFEQPESIDLGNILDLWEP